MFSSLRDTLCMTRLRTSSFILVWSGAAVHLLTVYVAAKMSGLAAAGLSLVFPVAAQVYWILALWQYSGVFSNIFTLVCLAYAGGWLAVSLSNSTLSGPPKLHLIDGGNNRIGLGNIGMKRGGGRSRKHAFHIICNSAAPAGRQTQRAFR